MTSGRLTCPDCLRNSPQGRHASCHVLALLREANGDRFWSKSDLLRTVYPYRWAQKLPGEYPNLAPIDGAISTLRKRGHRIVVWSGMAKLRVTAPAAPSTPTPGSTGPSAPTLAAGLVGLGTTRSANG